MNYWILQSNPRYFKLLDWLSDFLWLDDNALVDCWRISRFADKVQPGDIVFIWKSKGKSNVKGIYARGRIEPRPMRFPLEENEARYFIGKEGEAQRNRLAGIPVIAVRFTDLYLHRPLLSDTIENVPELHGLTILARGGACSRGIHELTIDHGRIIESLLG